MSKKIARTKMISDTIPENESKDVLNNSLNQNSFSDKEKDHREFKRLESEKRQKLKMEEKLKKELERKQKEEERKQKEEERKRKEEERKRKELEKEMDRKRKEAEKEEERKKKEIERKQKEFEKEEEKRKKEEDRRLKEIERDEEKRRKEEDRKKKEEEKRKEEDEKNKIIQKQRALLLGYLVKEKTDQDIPENKSCDLQKIGNFKPFEIKKDMKMSTIERIKKKKFRSLADFGNCNSQTYFDELSQGLVGNSSCSETWPLPEPDITLITSKWLKTKSLLFVENIRPSYFGTWRKKSAVITPLTPLAEDPSFFDYEVDSDQEWEYESGEDIASSDGEEDEEVNAEDPEDFAFLVPHGYLSDGEDIIDLDPGEDVPRDCVQTETATKSMNQETKKMLIEIREKQFQADLKHQVHQINPVIFGPCFVSNESAISSAQEMFQMVCRTGAAFPVNCNLQNDLDYAANGSALKIKAVPPEAVPHMIRLVHCNQMSRAKLCYEFRMFWELHVNFKLPEVSFDHDLQGKDWDEFSIGKKRFSEKLREIADRKDGMWIVKPEVIQEYQLCCNNDDPHQPCTEKWKYVSEVINIDSKRPAKTSCQKTRKRKTPQENTGSVEEKMLKLDNSTKPLAEKSL